MIYKISEYDENENEIGSISIQYDVYLSDNIKGAIISDFFVEENHRNKGLGTKLVKACLKVLENYDKEICVHCNNNSIRIFKKLGFMEKETYTILVK
jgi:predicted GNAT family acetyltransferase